MTDVKGRVAFITGGANGIGLGIARALAREGVKVALADVDAEALARAKAELAKTTRVATTVLDVRDRESYARAADAVEAELGAVSLLFNNAGVAGGAPAGKLTWEMWDWVMGVNLNGVINGVQTFLPRMLANGGGGHIVNTASGAGLVPTSSGVLYTTSKYAVVGMSESLNGELASAGIGVSVLCPGPVATDIVARTFRLRPESEKPASEEQRRREAASIEQTTQWLQSGKSPDDVGRMVLRAVRDNSLYIHTDRIVAGLIQTRTKALLDAFQATDE